MKKILSTTALTSALLIASSSANANNFGGFNLAINGSMAGITADGGRTGDLSSGTGTLSSKASVSAGAITPVASIDASYAFAVNPTFAIGIGVDYIPMKADLTVASSSTASGGATSVAAASTSNSFKGQVDKHYMVYVQPTFSINKDSAFFAKIGYQRADVQLPASVKTGSGSGVDETITNRSPELEGWSYSLGLKTFLTPQAFVAVEALYSDYDTIRTTTTQSTTGNTATKSYSASVEAVQARISLGFKF